MRKQTRVKGTKIFEGTQACCSAKATSTIECKRLYWL